MPLKSLLIIALLLVGCASKLPSPGARIPFVILHTNDTHGHFLPFVNPSKQQVGGFAAQWEIIKKIRKEVADQNGIFLLLSGGDINTGSPESDLFNAEPDLKGMEKMGYDAMALGNHELDGGIEKLFKQVAWVKFPILSANVKFSGREGIKRSVLIERAGVKIGILGLTTESVKKLILSSTAKQIEVTSAIEEAQKEVEALKKQKAEVIIAVTHLGVPIAVLNPKEIIQTDDVSLVKKMDGIDVVVGGHSHSLLPDGIKEGDSIILQAGEWGQYLGRMDGSFNLESRKLEDTKAQVIPVDPAKGETKELVAFFKTYTKQVEARLKKVLGRTKVTLDGEREQVRAHGTALGNLICDVMRKEAKADLAFFNGGGIRGSLFEGPIRLGDVLRILPFKNTLVTGTMSGAQIRKALEQGISSSQKMGGGLLHISGGKYEIRQGKLGQVSLLNGNALENDKNYQVAANNFVFGGGDGLDAFTEATGIEDSGKRVDELVEKQIRRIKLVKPDTQARILK